MGWIKQAGGIDARLQLGTPTATTTVATVIVSGGTLVSWDLDESIDDGQTWTRTYTNIVTSSQIAADLTPNTDYKFRATVRAIASGEATSTCRTEPAPLTVPAYRVITSDINVSDVTLNQKCWALTLKNNESVNINSIRIGGRNTLTSHAEIMGAWIIRGTLNTTTFQGTTYQRITFSGNNTFTPVDGAITTPTFWVSDRIILTTPLEPDEQFILRIQTDAGDLSTCLDFTAYSRPNYGDVLGMGLSIDDGDFGSDLSKVQTNPSGWYGNLNGFISTIEMGYESETEKPIAIVFGDSVVAGFIQGIAARDTWMYSCESNMTNGYVVSYGFPGLKVEEYCQVLQQWLNSSASDIYDTVMLPPWSWNNVDTDINNMVSVVSTAISAITQAGKHPVLWIDMPSALNSFPNGNNTTWTEMRDWARSSSTTLVETWQDVSTDGVGPTITESLTNDGVHFNEAGQVIQGTSLASFENVIFV